MMDPSIPLTRLAALPLSLLCLALVGCPDITLNASSAGSAGKLSLVQTIVQSDDPLVSEMSSFVMSPSDEKIYATSWHGNLITFNRSSTDGSLGRVYSTPLFNPSGLESTADGKHLYAVGANNPDLLLRLDVDPVTGEPVPIAPGIHVRGSELAIAANGAFLYESSRDLATIKSYRIDPVSGALTPGPVTPYDSPNGDGALLADDEHGALFANRLTADGSRYVVRYAVDQETGALSKVGEALANLWWGHTVLARCSGTTRVYVPQVEGSIGYADIGGEGISIPSSFVHPDLLGVRSAALSPDCKNLYAVTQQTKNGSLVVLSRDDAGDLSWLQTIAMGQGESLFALTVPNHARVSLDGKNVYVDSSALDEGFAVFARDTTGDGLP